MDNEFIKAFEGIYEDQLSIPCFNALKVFIITIDLNGSITFINNRAIELLGLQGNDMTGKDFIKDLIVKEEQKRIRLYFAELLTKKKAVPANIRYELLTNSREKRIIEAYNVKIFDRNNNIKGILISGKDLTDSVYQQQNLQKDINLYRTLLNNIPDINIFLFDTEFRFLMAEGVEMRNIDLSAKSFEGKSLFEISNEKIKKIWTPLFQKVLLGEKARKEYKINNFNYLIRITPLTDNHNKVTAGIAITRNITGEKLAKKILLNSREEAIKSEKAKSQFLARVSHEIRTPLNAIMGFAEQLLQSDLPHQQREYVEIIDKSSEHLLTLINDVLVYSKIEANQLSFSHHPFSIESVLNYVYKSFLSAAEEKNLQLIFEIDDRLNTILKGDSFRLQQILMNMVHNSIKFTNRGYIKLTCFKENETQHKVTVKFEVSDTGIGIPRSNLKKIFNQYTQVDSRDYIQHEGTGLGLTICKSLIELQNGSLSVSSQEGKGTKFTFTLSYTKGKETDILPYDRNKIDPKKLINKNILLVDDDRVNLILGETILKKFNCSFDLARNGKDAIEKLKTRKYDLILLDIYLPDISGIDIAHFFRNEIKDESCKIIVLTAAPLKDHIKKFSEAGIDDFLIKPFREIYLYNKICALLSVKDMEEENYLPEPKTELILKSEIDPKPYNLLELKKMMNNDRVFIEETINTFIENTEEAICNFKKYLQEKKWEQIGEHAHKILPSFRHLEIETVIPKLLEIKTKTLIEPDFNEVSELVKNTITDIEVVIEYLKKDTDL